MVLLNATLSEPDARFTTADIKDFFLMSDLVRPEYMWILLTQIPADRMQSAYYNGSKYAVNGKVVLVKLTKGIYGLPQAALLARYTSRHARLLVGNSYPMLIQTC
jgi:hypothetical protein